MTKEQQAVFEKLKRMARRYGQGRMTVFGFFVVEGINDKGEVVVSRVAQLRPAPLGHAVLTSMSQVLQEHGPIIQKELDEMAAKQKMEKQDLQEAIARDAEKILDSR